MKVNTWKSHLLFSGNSITTATIDNSYIELKDEQIFLGITIDSNLLFFWKPYQQDCKSKFKYPCKNRFLHEYTEAKNKREFVTSQFSYCPLIWILHSRGLNNK